MAYEEAVNDVARVEHQQAHIADTIEGRKAAHQKVAETAQRKAVELYMRGAASSPSALLSVANVGDVMSSAELLAAASKDDQASLNQLVALEADLERCRPSSRRSRPSCAK